MNIASEEWSVNQNPAPKQRQDACHKAQEQSMARAIHWRRTARAAPESRVWRILAQPPLTPDAPNFLVAACAEYERLLRNVEDVLGNLAQVSTLLLDMFRARDLKAVYGLDEKLEFTVGAKERCIGALRQHLRDHKCQGDDVT